MHHNRGLLHEAQNVTARNLLAHLCLWVKKPFLLEIQRVHRDTAGDVHARLLPDLSERTLDPVVDHANQSRSKRHRQRTFGMDHFLARHHAGRLLIDLHGRLIAQKTDYLSYQSLVTDLDHIIHLGSFHPVGLDHRACYQYDPPFFCLHYYTTGFY